MRGIRAEQDICKVRELARITIDPNLLARLGKHPDESIRLRVASNPITTRGTLAGMKSDVSEVVRNVVDDALAIKELLETANI